MNNANGNIKYFVVVDDAASAEDKDKDGDPDALSTPLYSCPLTPSTFLPSFLPSPFFSKTRENLNLNVELPLLSKMRRRC